jgi:hypothetical protein
LLYADLSINICIAEYMSHKIINETAAAAIRRKRVNENKREAKK